MDTFLKLLLTTGHEPIEPANQFCKHCGAALFVKEQSEKPCSYNPMRTKNAIPLRYFLPQHSHKVPTYPYGPNGPAIASTDPFNRLQWYAGVKIGWVDIQTTHETDILEANDET